MGLLTLPQFRDEIASNLGGHNLEPTRLTRFVNYAIQDLATRRTFDELLVRIPFFVFDGVTSYTIPDDLLGIHEIVVKDVPLRRMERQFNQVDVTPAQPSHYKRREDRIIIWREPDIDYVDGYLEYYKFPAIISTATSVSPFPGYWDQGLVFLGTHHGWLALGEAEKAVLWDNKFSRFEDGRLSEEDISADVQQEGLNVAWDFQDLVNNPPHL